MPIAMPARLAVLCAAACLTVGGCGKTADPPRGTTSLQAPRRFELPPHVQPIPRETSEPEATLPAESIAAQYQQPQPPPTSPGPRIVEISSLAAQPAAGAIREPIAGSSESVNSVPTTPPQPRSEFVPIAMPEPSIVPQPEPPPHLPAQPTFTAAHSPAATTVAAAGPQLAPPTAAAVGQAFLPAATRESVAADKAADKNVCPTYPNVAPNPAAMQVVSQRALQLADHAASMAQRGMFYSARSELIQALQLIAQSLDVQDGASRHAAALAAGLTALSEARDFSTAAARPEESVNMAAIAATHRTSLAASGGAAPISPVIAQQQYFAQAQAQLAVAVGGLPAGSQILYRLGRLQTAMAAHDSEASALHAPQAIVFHQTALATDGGNWLAANELGVLYARYGQLAEARGLLLHSVGVHPHVEGWQNLAVVHSRLGETDLAQQAQREGQLLASRTAPTPAASNEMVRWVDPQTFAASGGPDVKWNDNTAAKSVVASPHAARR